MNLIEHLNRLPSPLADNVSRFLTIKEKAILSTTSSVGKTIIEKNVDWNEFTKATSTENGVRQIYPMVRSHFCKSDRIPQIVMNYLDREDEQPYSIVQSQFPDSNDNVSPLVMQYLDLDMTDLVIDDYFQKTPGLGSIVSGFLGTERSRHRRELAYEIDQVPDFFLRGIGGVFAYANLPSCDFNSSELIKKGVDREGDVFFRLNYAIKSEPSMPLCTEIVKDPFAMPLTNPYWVVHLSNTLSCQYLFGCKATTLPLCAEHELTQLREDRHPHFTMIKQEPVYPVIQ